MTNHLKTVNQTEKELRVANYIILFGGTDLTGEHFTKSTEIESAFTETGVLYVDFEHGLDPDEMGITSDDVLGYVDWKTARIDDKGVFVERVLNRQGRYMDVIEPLIEAGLVGTSSEAAHGKTQRTEDGEIKKWPLVRDSLTFTPAEPRMLTANVLLAAKSLHYAKPELKSLSELIAQHNEVMKSAIEGAESRKEFEDLFRNVCGLSKGDAKALVSRIRSTDSRNDEAEKTVDMTATFQNLKL